MQAVQLPSNPAGFAPGDANIALPAAVLNLAALNNNITWLQQFCQHEGIDFAPHGKTSMMLEVFRMQVEAGAFAISVAQASHIDLAMQSGVSNVIVANQTIAGSDLDALVRVLQQGTSPRIFAFVDSAYAVDVLAERLRAGGVAARPQMLLECGVAGGRCGIRDLDGAAPVLAALKAARDVLDFAGIAGFEGSIATGPGIEQRILDFLAFMADTALLADRQNAFSTDEIMLTAGGSKFFDLVVQRLKQASLSRPTRIVIRSGCLSFHDHGMYQTAYEALVQRSETARDLPVLRQSLEVFAAVLSRPEGGMVIAGAGKRHMPYDAGLPVPLRVLRDGKVTTATLGAVKALNDQHVIINCQPEDDVAVGDIVVFGISHPCTLFDKWKTILAVDDSSTVVGAYKTWF